MTIVETLEVGPHRDSEFRERETRMYNFIFFFFQNCQMFIEKYIVVKIIKKIFIFANKKS